jgi:hypothetical protein
VLKQSKPFAFRKTVAKTSRKDSGTVDETISKVLLEISKLHAKKERIKRGGVESSSIVKSAASDGVERRRRALDSVKNAEMTKEHTFAPKINRNIPDFERIQREFGERRKSVAKETTRTEPFSITDSLAELSLTKTAVVIDDDDDDGLDTAIATRWPFLKTKRVAIGKEFTAKYTSAGVTQGTDTKKSLMMKQTIAENRRMDELAKEKEEVTRREKERKSKVHFRLSHSSGSRTRYIPENRSYQTRWQRHPPRFNIPH